MAPKTRQSQSIRAGIIFPVARIHRLLKSGPTATTRVTKGASVYAAAVIEYLVGMYSIQSLIIIYKSLSIAELLELSGNAARDNKRTRINPRHILLAYANDTELNTVRKKYLKKKLRIQHFDCFLF
jgi:histone H2A